LADQISIQSLALAALFCDLALGMSVWFFPLAWEIWAAALAGSAFAFWRTWRLFARRLQGFTGDCLGTTQQVSELAFYLGWALALGWVAR
jgi:adenosylcobinamide-GDP ribazoletransferase